MNSDPTPTSTEMTTPLTEPKPTAIVEVSPQTDALIEEEMGNADQKLKQETKALVEAIKMRAQSEAKGAGDLTRDAYLNAVRQARETVEQNKLFDPERIEYSFWLIQKDAEKNWQSILNEASTIGDRLADAAKAAWETLTAPRPQSDNDQPEI